MQYFNNLFGRSSTSTASSLGAASSSGASSSSAVSIRPPELPLLDPHKVLPLEHIPLSDQEIQEYSLLQNGTTPLIRKENPTPLPHGLSFFASDFFSESISICYEISPSFIWLIDATPFERGKKEVLLRELRSYALIMSKITSIKGRLSEKSVKAQLSNFANTLAEEVRQLPVGEVKIIPGRSRGITTLVEFSKTGEDTYSVTIFGSSSFISNRKLQKGCNFRALHSLTYENVPGSKLFFTSPSATSSSSASSSSTHSRARNDFFFAILQMLKEDVEQEHYLSFFDYLGDPKINPTIPVPTVSKKKFSLLTLLKLWMHKILGSSDEYRKVMFRLKLKLLLETFKKEKAHFGNNHPSSLASRRSLNHNARNLLRGVAKLLKSGGISPEEAQVATSTAYDIIKQIQLIDTQLAIGLTNSYKPTNFSTSRANSLNHQKLLGGHKKIETEKPDFFPEPLPPYPYFEFTHFSELVENVVICNFLCSQYKIKSFAQSRDIAIEHIVEQLPIPNGSNDYWDQLDETSRPKAITLLLNMLRLYGDFISSEPHPRLNLDRLTRLESTVVTLQAILHHLIVKQDREDLESLIQAGLVYNPPFLDEYKIAHFADSFHQFNICYLDRKEYERIQSAYLYFNTFNEGKKWISQNYFECLIAAYEQFNSGVTEVAEHRIDVRGIEWRTLSNEEIEEEYNQEIELYEAWNRANDLYQERNNYTSQLNEYFKLHDEWKRDPNNSPKPIEPKAPPSEVLEAPNPGIKPPEPQKRVNVPIEIRKRAIVEELDGHIYERFNLPMPPLLNILSFYTQRQLISSAIVNQNYSLPLIRYFRTSKYNDDLIVSSEGGKYGADFIGTRVIKSEPEGFKDDNQFHPLDDKTKSLFKAEVCHRKTTIREREIAEVKALKLDTPTSEFIKNLLRTASEHHLTPYQLIQEAQKEFEAFTDPNIRGLFSRLFFRSTVTRKRKVLLGAGDLLISDRGALKQACHHFISEGLEYFSTKDTPLEGGDFFFEFAFYLARYLRDGGNHLLANELSQIPLIETWLEEKTQLGSEEKAKLHFYRMLFLSLSPNIDSDENVFKVYESWIFYGIHFGSGPGAQTWKHSIEEVGLKFIQKLSYEIQDRLNEDVEFRNRFCSGILLSMGITPPSTENNLGFWREPSNLTLHWHNQKNIANYNITPSYTITLIPFPKVTTPEGSVNKGPGEKLWEKTEIFQKLFGEHPNIQYHQCGNQNIFQFSVPQYEGIFRIINFQERFELERQFPGTDYWVRCQNIETFVYGAILSPKYTFWLLSYEDQQIHQIQGYYTSIKNQKRKFALLKNGITIEVDSKTGQRGDNSRNLFYESDKFKHFDSHVIYFTPQGETQKIDRVEFTRFHSTEGVPLAFINNQKGSLVWTENQQYCLPEKMPEGYLGLRTDYLFLAPLQNNLSPKLLIPYKPGYDGKTDKNTDPYSPANPPKDEITKNDNLYFIYDVDGLTLKPTTAEAQAYLAYLYNRMERQREAVELIQGLEISEGLSKTTLAILESIIIQQYQKRTFQSNYVGLHAALKKAQQLDRQALEPLNQHFNEFETKILLDNIYYYYNRNNNIPILCKLTTEDEYYLITRILNFNDLPSVKTSYKEIIDLLNERKTQLEAGRPFPLLLKEMNDTPVIGLTRKTFTTFENLKNRFEMFSPQNPFQGLRKYHTPDLANALIARMRETFIEEPMEKITPPSYLNSFRFLNLFLQSAQSANEQQRAACLFWLKTWRQAPLEYSGKSEEIIDLYTLFWLEPSSFPAPFNMGKDQEFTVENILKFQATLLDAYKKIQPIYKNYYPNLPDQSKQEPFRENIEKYPIREKPISESKKFLSLTEKTPERTVAVLFDEQESRWKTLSDWMEYLGRTDLTIPQAEQTPYTYTDEMLDGENKANRDPLITALEKAQNEYLAGKTKNEAATPYTITVQNSRNIRAAAAAKILSLNEELKKKTERLVELINKEPSDPTLSLVEKAELGGQTKKRMTLEDAITALLHLDVEVYRKMNPNLSDEEIKEIVDLSLSVCDLKSYLAQLERVRNLAIKLDSVTLSELERNLLLQKLAGELSTRYTFNEFDDETQVALRVFSGNTGKIPYPHQTQIIKEMLALDETDPARYRDIVVQLIMGGGKTSVIATIMMYLSSRRKGRISLFIVPPSLFNTVRANLKESLREAFHIDLESIDLKRREMTPFQLDRLRDLMTRAAEESIPLISKATSLQSLQLEFLVQIGNFHEVYKDLQEDLSEYGRLQTQIKKLEGYGLYLTKETKTQIAELVQEKEKLEANMDGLRKRSDQAKTKLVIIRDILKLFKTSTDVMMDEVDQLLNALFEVNFPKGNKIAIPANGNGLLLQIFKGLISKEILAKSFENGPESSVDELVNLTKKDRIPISKTTFIHRIAPAIAEHLAITHKPFNKLVKTHKEAFIRYLSNKTPPFIERYIHLNPNELTAEFLNTQQIEWKKDSINTLQQDLRFLKHLKELYEHSDIDQNDPNNPKEQAKLIALARGLLTVILPATLSKSGNKNYGNKEQSNGEVCPYTGVNTEATTKFGFHWEEACYYYQWAAACPPSKNQILALANEWSTAAREAVEIRLIPFEETPEYTYFFELFGVDIREIQKPDVLERALENIQKDKIKQLELQFENVAEKVSYYPSRYNSNGANFCSMFSSNRAMSGTPWNVEGYPISLLARYLEDTGTEGRVIDSLTKKVNPEKLLEIDLSSVTSFLRSSLAQIPSELHSRVTGITEAAGLFKKFSRNDLVAKEIMSYLSTLESHQHIEGVLFFHRESAESSDDTLYVWKKGAKRPEKVGGSSPEALMSKNLSPEKYFTYYAERNTTGTDIPQIPNGITLLTFDEQMTERNTAQALMRYREFLTTQDTFITMTPEGRQSLHNGGKRVSDLILHGIIVQTVNKAEHLKRHYRQNIHNLFRGMTLETLLESTERLTLDSIHPEIYQSFIEQTEPFLEFVELPLEDDAYLQFGSIQDIVETKEDLKEILNNKSRRFESVLSRVDVPRLERFRSDVEHMRTHIESAKSLPKYDMKAAAPLGIEIEEEIEQESLIQVDTELQTENEVEREIEIELQSYQYSGDPASREEQKLSQAKFEQYLAVMLSESPGVTKLPQQRAIISINDQLGKYKYGKISQRKRFEEIFTQPIYGTDSYFYSTMQLLSVFDKRQRPPKQILAFRMPDGSFRWLLLSEREARYAQKHLKTLYRENSPLVAEGVWLINSEGMPLEGLHDNGERFPHLENISNLDDREIEENLICQGLLEINAFGGNVIYLNRHFVSAKKWLETHSELKIHFLKIKSCVDQKQKRAYQTSPIFSGKKETLEHAPKKGIQRARIKSEQMHAGTYKPSSIVELKLNGSTPRIGELNAKFVYHLGIDLDANPLSEEDQEAIAELEKAGRDIPTEVEALRRLQFLALRPYHGPYITARQVKWLPPEQTKILTEKSQFCRFAATGEIEEYLLNEEQIFGNRYQRESEGLEKSQSHLIPFVNPEFYGRFDKKWQIRHVPPTQIHRISRDYFDFLSDEQVRGIKDPHILNDLVAFWIERGEPEKMALVPGNFIRYIPNEYKKFIQPNQIEEITEPVLIRELEHLAEATDGEVPAGEWTSHINPLMVPEIDVETQLQYLHNQLQIHEIPNEWVPRLNIETQVPFISRTQVNSLTNDQLLNCPNPLVQYLEPVNIEMLPDDKLVYLRGEGQIRAIRQENRFAHLSGEIGEGIANQMQWIEESQYQWIQSEQVKGLRKEQLLAISRSSQDVWLRIRDHITPEQIHTFDSQDLIDLLTPEQITEHLQRAQVQYLRTDDQILSCPDPFIGELSIVQLDKVTPEKIARLDGRKVEKVPVRLLQYLTVDQVQFVPRTKLHYLTLDQVPGLKKEQLLWISQNTEPHYWSRVQGSITGSQAQTFNTKESFNLLSPEQITQWAQENQVPFMETVEQIHACPSHLVKFLDPDTQVPHISVEQVQYLESELQLAKMPVQPGYFENVAVSQYPHLPEGLKGRLTVEQISHFERTATTTKVIGFTLEQVKGLQTVSSNNPQPLSLINHLATSQFGQIRDNDEDGRLLEGLNQERVKEIGPEHENLLGRLPHRLITHLPDRTLRGIPANKVTQLKAVSENKIHKLTEEQIRARDLSSLKARIGYRILGAIKTMFIPMMLVTQAVIDLAKTVFAGYRYLRVKNAQTRSDLKKQWTATWYWNPKITIVGALQMWKPERSWIMQGRLCEARDR